MLFNEARAVEIHGLGVFAPEYDEWALLRNPMEKIKPTSLKAKKLSALKKITFIPDPQISVKHKQWSEQVF
jgi:hypothetical protein